MAKRKRTPNPRWCEDTWQDALEALRETLRTAGAALERPNPFARPLPCPIADPKRTATILRIF